jgi:hypothetical protein
MRSQSHSGIHQLLQFWQAKQLKTTAQNWIIQIPHLPGRGQGYPRRRFIDEAAPLLSIDSGEGLQ